MRTLRTPHKNKDTNKKLSARRKAIAYHEAGHAVVAYVLGAQKFRRVTIDRRLLKADTLGAVSGSYSRSFRERMDSDFDDRLVRDVEREVMVLLGGWAAQKILTGRSSWLGARSDTNKCADFLFRLWGNTAGKLKDTHFKYLKERAYNILSIKQKWSYVQAVAKALLEKENLSYQEVVEIIRDDSQRQSREHVAKTNTTCNKTRR